MSGKTWMTRFAHVWSGRMLAMTALVLLAGCAATVPDEDGEAIHDPLEPVNRFVFAVNDGVDTLVLSPVATIYREGVPTPVQTGVRNVLRNLKGPIHVADALLAGEGEAALHETGRFIINSTVGLAGIFDVAADQGLPTTEQDLGRSLGKMGIGEGPYLVLPLMGPSNLRDAVGQIGEGVADPFNYVVRNTGNSDLVMVRTGAVVVSERAANDDVIRTLKRDAVDYYARTRSAYTQRRRAQVEADKPDAAPVEKAAAAISVTDAAPAAPAPVAAPAMNARPDLYGGTVRYRSPDDRP